MKSAWVSRMPWSWEMPKWSEGCPEILVFPRSQMGSAERITRLWKPCHPPCFGSSCWLERQLVLFSFQAAASYISFYSHHRNLSFLQLQIPCQGERAPLRSLHVNFDQIGRIWSPRGAAFSKVNQQVQRSWNSICTSQVPGQAVCFNGSLVSLWEEFGRRQLLLRQLSPGCSGIKGVHQFARERW